MGQKILYEENKIVLNDYFKERKDLDMDEYVVKDYHVNKKYGLDKFATEGAYVKDEYLDDLKEGELYKEYYIEKKIEKSQIDKDKKSKPNKFLISLNLINQKKGK